MTVEEVADLLIWDASSMLVKLSSMLEEDDIPCFLDIKNTCLSVYASEDDKLGEHPAFEIHVSKEITLEIRCSEEWSMAPHEMYAWEVASLHTKELMIRFLLKELRNES